MDGGWNDLADSISRQLPGGPRVAALGSASLHHPDTDSTCKEIGHLLAAIPGLVLLTGGVGGVGATIGKSYYRARRDAGQPDRVFHILPEDSRPPNYGKTFFAGEDMHDRREVLARLSSVYLVVEGGPGTVHETSVASSREAILIPVGRSGGHAAQLYETQHLPAWVDAKDWQELGEEISEPRKVARSLANVIKAAICEQLIRPARLAQQGVLKLGTAWLEISAYLPNDEELVALLSLLSPDQRRLMGEIFPSSDPGPEDGNRSNSKEGPIDREEYAEFLAKLRSMDTF